MSERKNNRSYKTWSAMLQRCTNQNNPRYVDYGGRGITVCKRWLLFDNFFADMGERPIGMSIDRINVNGNYEKRNCRWADDTTQAQNARSNIAVECRGRTLCLSAWARELGINKDCVFGWRRQGVNLAEKISFLLDGGVIAPHWSSRKTHCINGHEFTKENTRTKGIRRTCRECERIRERMQQQGRVAK